MPRRQPRHDGAGLMRNHAKPNCIATTGIIFLSLGLIMIVWGVTSTAGVVDLAESPLLIAGIVFFGSGFFTVFIVSVHQQACKGEAREVHNNNMPSTPSTLGHDSPVFEIQVDEPPSYNDCFVIDVSTTGTTFPSPELMQTLKKINDLPSYQDLFGNKGEGSSSKS